MHNFNVAEFSHRGCTSFFWELVWRQTVGSKHSGPPLFAHGFGGARRRSNFAVAFDQTCPILQLSGGLQAQHRASAYSRGFAICCAQLGEVNRLRRPPAMEI